MNNTQGTQDVALTVFGGAVPELSPEDLPEGASPQNQDCDYSPGKVFTRGARQNQVQSFNLFSERLAGLGVNVPAANEVPWTTPNNITLNSPPNYASVALNTATALSNGIGAFDSVAYGAVTVTPPNGHIASTPLTPSSPPEFALMGSVETGGVTFTPDAGWGAVAIFGQTYAQEATGGAIAAGGSIATLGPVGCALALMLFKQFGSSAPTVVQTRTIDSGAFPGGTYNTSFSSPVTNGNTILVICECNSTTTGGPFFASVTDGVNSYSQFAAIGSADGGVPNHVCEYICWGAQNVTGGALTVSVNLQGLGIGTMSGALYMVEIQGGVAGAPSLPTSELLRATNFGFSIPSTQGILGFQVEVTGHQTTLNPDAVLTVALINPSASSPTMVFQLPLSDSQVVLGSPNTNWGLALTPAILNNPAFGVNIQATTTMGEAVTFDISAVKIKAFLTPNPPSNFNWIKTYEQTDGEIDTLALDATGVLWDENVSAAPGTFNSIFTAIEPNTFAKSVTFDDTEYIAFSDLTNGTDVPRLWNGTWLDRVSQVGPGAAPSVATTSSGSTVTSITQHAATILPTGAHDFLLLSASPSAQGTFGLPATPGNVLTIIPHVAFVPPTNADGTPLIVVGSNIQISGFPMMNGQNPNNDPAGVFNPAYYTVTSVGTPIPGMQSFDWITFQVPFTTFFASPTPGGCSIQATIATLTAAQQVPFLEVGDQFTVTGASVAGYDNTFVVQATPNASQLSITQTSLTSNVAQFVFTLISGSAPTLGEFVTVTGTLNGNGIFNVTNAVITAASPSTFSVTLTSASNITAAPETGNGIISGTIFRFDPVGVVTNPILGNSTGGTISTSGVLGVGIRQAVVIFQTRNGALTAPSPFVQFNITGAATAIVVSNIPIGPPNVTARIIAFTGANGGNFFYIPQPVTVTSNGQQITYSSTIINDNITTQATLSFPDAVLLAATAIDIQGNNLFEQIELGSSIGFLSYASRLIAWGEQNKVQNLQNLSFDGGLGIQSTGGSTYYPLGWTVDPTNGTGGTVQVSPIFGDSYYIKNSTGSTQAFYGMITQGAFQDQFQVPIITTNTAYSVRVTARCPSQIGSGNLVMDLFSPLLNQVFGSFTVPLASMGTTMKIFSGTMLTTVFKSVPNDLRFRVYATALPNGGDVELDRVEPFPTTEPVFTTQFRASYANNPEAFDLVTGGFGPDQNQQPIRGGAVLFDSLYALKERSMYSTNDNGVTEPDNWSWREVSNRVGTIGIHSYDFGEGWLVTACRAGVFLFTGGVPVKISQEIQPVWDAVNWSSGHTIWLRNDEVQKRITIGVPITTPNIFMPQLPVNLNPTTPNVIININYRELETAAALESTGPIRSSFTGRLLSPEPARKSSFWNIACPYSDFIDRANDQWPQWYCTGYQNSKLYQLIDGATDDDGLPINSYYVTFGMVKPDQQDAKGLGLRRMLLAYLSFLAEGQGNLNIVIYTQSPQNVPYTLQSIPLTPFTLGDLEAVVNCEGERFFIGVGTNAVGSRFQLSKVVAALQKSAWSPIRGTAIPASF